ncbi:MAG TPA: non-homologous end-joining DNA ligase [Edaphobacter sp.]|nr:non-homologous end-joining DNA ligase [Edaphobacter sp.]
MATNERMAHFIEPMECLPVEKIPEGDLWTYELKLDGYRIEAVKSGGKVTLYSRRGTDLSQRFEYVASALASLPDETVIDGEIVALDEQGKPNFNLLQNFRSAKSHIMLYAFDVLVHRGKDLTKTMLSKRREILTSTIQPHDHVGVSQVSNQRLEEMLAFVKSHGLEGIIAKRADSVYEPGRRSGLWVKHRINLSQSFVIGGYVPSHLGVDAIVIGFYRDKQLHYAARVRAGFVPLTRRQVFERIKPLETAKCPFVNLPEKDAGRWGQGLTAEKMKECVWVKPRIVAEVAFLEWTGANHLRHTKIVGLRDDKDPARIVRETPE